MKQNRYHDHDDRKPRDRKRTHRAKRQTINRRAERAAKRTMRGQA